MKYPEPLRSLPSLKCRPLFLAVAVPLMLAGCGGTGGGSGPSPLDSGATSNMSPESRVRVGQSFLRTGNIQQALNLFNEAAEAAPRSPDPLIGLGQAFLALGDTTTAAEYFRRARALGPDRLDATAGLARAYVANREPAEAVATLEAWRADGKDLNGPMFNILGLAYDLLGAHEQAKSAYREGLDQVPGDPAISNNLALSFAVEGRFSEAVELLQDNLNNPLTQEEARENLALIYALSGQLEAARQVALTVLSEEAVGVNMAFYSRLSALSSRDRARAVFLGELPRVAQTPTPEPPPPSREEKAREAALEQAQAAAALSVASLPDEEGEQSGVGPAPSPANDRSLAVAPEGAEDSSSENSDQQPAEAAAGASGDVPRESADLARPLPDNEVVVPVAPGQPEPARSVDDAAGKETTQSAEREIEPADSATPSDLASTNAGDLPDTAERATDQPKSEDPARAGEPVVTAQDLDPQPEPQQATPMTEAPSDATRPQPDAASNERQTATLAEDVEDDAGTEGVIPFYRVQLGSFRRAEGTGRRWEEIESEFSELVVGLNPVVQLVESESGDVYHRLIVGKIPGYTRASTLCEALAQQSLPCVVTQDQSDTIALSELLAGLDEANDPVEPSAPNGDAEPMP